MKTCIRDYCGMPFDPDVPETRDTTTLRPFWQRYCPKHRVPAEPPIIITEVRMTVQEKAQQIWKQMGKNQQTGVRFGLFPHDVMAKAEAEGFDGHELCIALMDCAKKDGGMRA